MRQASSGILTGSDRRSTRKVSDSKYVAFNANREGPLEQVFRWKAIMQITEAVIFLHEQNVVHRDIKPENIFVSKGIVRTMLFRSCYDFFIVDCEIVKLGDFGISKYQHKPYNYETDQGGIDTLVKPGTPG